VNTVKYYSLSERYSSCGSDARVARVEESHAGGGSVLFCDILLLNQEANLHNMTTTKMKAENIKMNVKRNSPHPILCPE